MNRLAGMLSYLIGPMDYATDKGAGWRLEITPFLHSLNVGVLNPCDKPTTLTDVIEDDTLFNKINDAKRLARKIELEGDISGANALYGNAHNHAKQFVRYDLRMVDIGHFMVMHINPDIHMCGSYGEQSMACLERKPVVGFCPQGKDKIPNWLFGILKPELLFSSLQEVKNYLLHVNNDPVVDDHNRWRFIDMNKVYGRKVF